MPAPAWAPSLPQVADYVPGRTIVGAADGYGNVTSTFSETTHPTDVQVTRLIEQACSWVMLKTGAVHESLTADAALCAAVWTAAMVEQGYPDNRDDLSTAEALYRQAVQMRDDLDRANAAKTGDNPEDPAAHLMPVWSFPAAPAWGDETFL